jgi:hypothetical protein
MKQIGRMLTACLIAFSGCKDDTDNGAEGGTGTTGTEDSGSSVTSGTADGSGGGTGGTGDDGGTGTTGTEDTGDTSGTGGTDGTGITTDAGTSTDTSSASGTTGSTDTGSVSCESKYEPDQICEEGEGSCTFYVVLDGSTCEDYCQSHGGECIAAGADSAEPCVAEEPRPCDEPATDMLCTCTL